MKKMKKRFLAISICFAVLFGSLTPVQVADAAPKNVKTTVRYKGKNVTFETFRSIGYDFDKYKSKIKMNAKTYASVKKAWGKANKVEKNDYGTSYTWKSGKTRIAFYTYENGKRKGDLFVDIQNKKASVYGIKVGMSKKQALQKLKKQFGKKYVISEKNQILIQTPMGPIEINLKSGKVKSIHISHS